MKGQLLVYQSLIPGVSAPDHQLRLDVQCFLWPVVGLDYLYYLYYVGPLFHILGFKYYAILYYTDPLIHVLGHNV